VTDKRILLRMAEKRAVHDAAPQAVSFAIDPKLWAGVDEKLRQSLETAAHGVTVAMDDGITDEDKVEGLVAKRLSPPSETANAEAERKARAVKAAEELKGVGPAAVPPQPSAPAAAPEGAAIHARKPRPTVREPAGVHAIQPAPAPEPPRAREPGEEPEPTWCDTAENHADRIGMDGELRDRFAALIGAESMNAMTEDQAKDACNKMENWRTIKAVEDWCGAIERKRKDA
jgi:hypothetical protein